MTERDDAGLLDLLANARGENAALCHAAKERIEELEHELAEAKHDAAEWMSIALMERRERAEAQSASMPRSRLLVEAQAKDIGLWFEVNHLTELYLQRALRALHAAVEADTQSATRRDDHYLSRFSYGVEWRCSCGWEGNSVSDVESHFGPGLARVAINASSNR